MASLNTAARELVLKIVYYGPGLGGKTTSLQSLHESAPAERRGKLVSLATPVDRTLYFDFLPLRLPPLRGLAVRLQLFTVPGQVYFNATRRLVLSGADGIVFVADSQIARMDSNLESLENLRENLAEHGRDLATLPHTFAYNKRDLDEIVPQDELDRVLNRHNAISFGTVATRGEQVQATLDEITRAVLAAYEAQLPASNRSVIPETEPATSVPAEPPTVKIRRGGDEEIVVTSAGSGRAVSEVPARSPSADGDDVVTSSTLKQPSAGTFLADLERLEAAVARPRDDDPESVVGEAWDDAPREPPSLETSTFTFAPLFAPGERALIEQIEASIAHGAYSDALGMCDAALSRLLASVAVIVSHEGAKTEPTDPALPLLLGLDGRRYLTFRALARRARRVGDVGVRDVLESFAFVLEARVAAGQWDAVRSAVGATSSPPPARPTPAPPSGLPPLPRSTISPPPDLDEIESSMGQS